MLARRFLLAAIACVAGCGSSVVLDPSTSGNPSGGGDAGMAGAGGTALPTGGTAGAAAGGTGGFGGSAGLGGFGGDIIGTGGSNPDYCAGTDFFFDILGDGPDQHYDIMCQPDGYIYLG